MCVNKFLLNNAGVAFPIVAVFLAVIFLIGGLIVDSGSYYVRYGEIQNLSQHGSNAGLLRLEDLLKDRAQNNKNILCADITNLPVICSSNNFWHFISDVEITNLISTSNTNLQVSQSVTDFVVDFDPRSSLDASNVSIVFPYDYEIGHKIKLKSFVSVVPTQVFANLLPLNEAEIKTSSVAFLKISR